MASTAIAYNVGGVNCAVGYTVARTDYAVLVGSSPNNSTGGGPPTGSDTYPVRKAFSQVAANYFGQRATSNISLYTGISYELSTTRKDDITDGPSQTILVGEKYLNPENYATGADPGDDENLYSGYNNDTGRVTGQTINGQLAGSPPMQDQWGKANITGFGSAHPNAANFALCDGAVIGVSYAVDPNTFLGAGIRRGRTTAPYNLPPTDMSKLGGG
jgi:prepilin-type processing-associated H-X9-DG protein